MKSKKFYAQLRYLIPGNCVSWRISTIENITGKVKIPDNYELSGVTEVLNKITVSVIQLNPFQMPTVFNAKALESAVFTFEKTGKETFRVLDYAGQLKTETKNTIDTTSKGE